MARIADPIQEAQSWASQESVQGVVFDHDGVTSCARGLVEQPHRVLRMMQHIDKQYDIKRCIAIGNADAVERFDRNMGLPSDDDVKALHIDVRAPLHEPTGKQAIAAADVQHLGVLWEELLKVVTKHPHPASMDESSMESFHEAHLRRIPRILMKKLESTV
jgi:hypothetical protein